MGLGGLKSLTKLTHPEAAGLRFTNQLSLLSLAVECSAFFLVHKMYTAFPVSINQMPLDYPPHLHPSFTIQEKKCISFTLLVTNGSRRHLDNLDNLRTMCVFKPRHHTRAGSGGVRGVWALWVFPAWPLRSAAKVWRWRW